MIRIPIFDVEDERKIDSGDALRHDGRCGREHGSARAVVDYA
jgi:hypothetical protein